MRERERNKYEENDVIGGIIILILSKYYYSG